MNSMSWTRRRLAFAAALAVSLSATAYLSLAITHPKPVVSVLGPEWECRRVVFLTSCTRAGQIQPVANRIGKGNMPGRGV